MSGAALMPEGLVVHSHAPLNAEPPLARLAGRRITPAGDFYVRTHGDIPQADAQAWRLGVDGLVGRRLELDLAALAQRFQGAQEEAFLQCAGNRRADFQPVRPTGGDPWGGGAIGNARWEGVRLADVLRAAGVDEGRARHVAFTGRDTACQPEPDGGGLERYSVSIPLAKALSPEVLLATGMNGAPLRPEHGFPLRLVVPGYAGARSCKWLERIEVRDSPSPGRYQSRDYKLFPAEVEAETVDWSKGVVIDEMPVNAAICTPAAFAELPAGPLTLTGWAAASGRAVTRVDVSIDGARTWRQAELDRDPAAPWAWTLWRARVELAPGEHELCCRAWDAAGQTQPEAPDAAWNFKGFLCASIHRVRVRVV